MRRLTVFLTVLICFALLACGGSSSSKYVPPKSSIIVYDLAVYERVCGDWEWEDVAKWPTYTIYEDECYTLLSQVSSPDYNIYSFFVEITDPAGNVDVDEVLYAWSNTYDLAIYPIYWLDPLIELYCGTYEIELWVKDTGGLDSNSVSVSVEAGEPCTAVPLTNSLSIPAKSLPALEFGRDTVTGE